MDTLKSEVQFRALNKRPLTKAQVIQEICAQKKNELSASGAVGSRFKEIANILVSLRERNLELSNDLKNMNDRIFQLEKTIDSLKQPQSSNCNGQVLKPRLSMGGSTAQSSIDKEKCPACNFNCFCVDHLTK